MGLRRDGQVDKGRQVVAARHGADEGSRGRLGGFEQAEIGRQVVSARARAVRGPRAWAENSPIPTKANKAGAGQGRPCTHTCGVGLQRLLEAEASRFPCRRGRCGVVGRVRVGMGVRVGARRGRGIGANGMRGRWERGNPPRCQCAGGFSQKVTAKVTNGSHLSRARVGSICPLSARQARAGRKGSRWVRRCYGGAMPTRSRGPTTRDGTVMMRVYQSR